MVSIVTVLLTVLVMLLAVFLRHLKSRQNNPPGPLGFPILGLIPFRIVELVFAKWLQKTTETEKYKINREKYGSIWSFVYGNQRVIVLSSRQVINEAFIDNAELFSGKPNNAMYKLFGQGRGILLGNGEMWLGHRRLAIRSLKDLGMGKQDLEYRICEECDEFISYLKGVDTNNFNLTDALIKGVANVVISLVFQEKNRYDDPTFTNYAANLSHVNQSDVFDTKLSLSPTLFQTGLMRKLFPDISKFLCANQFCSDFIKDKCSTRLKKQNENQFSECLFDNFQRCRFLNSSSSLSNEEKSAEILQCMCDIFSAAIDTVSNFLSFCCLFLGKYEYIQTELRTEIRTLTETSGEICLDFRKRCPKLLSFIDEVQRFCCLVPKVHHRVIKETVFCGYKLYPTDVIYGDLANLFRDPDVFEEPTKFNAYRFTDESRTKYCPSKHLIPFGIGKRSCLGESIAKMESFIFLTKIIDQFQITLTDETSKEFENIVKGDSGIIHVPLLHFMDLKGL